MRPAPRTRFAPLAPPALGTRFAPHAPPAPGARLGLAAPPTPGARLGLAAPARSVRLALTGALLAALAAACAPDDEAAETDVAPIVGPGDPAFQRDPSLDVELASRRGGTTSHKAGTNCMQCHQQRGPGPGQFTVAGTAYGEDGAPRPDATLRLADTMGQIVLEVESDAYGNFFSTAPLPWPEAELFPRVQSADAKAASAMPFSTISGACNLCHTPIMRVVLRDLP